MSYQILKADSEEQLVEQVLAAKLDGWRELGGPFVMPWATGHGICFQTPPRDDHDLQNWSGFVFGSLCQAMQMPVKIPKMSPAGFELEHCPTCGGVEIFRCGCRLRERRCPNGHLWPVLPLGADQEHDDGCLGARCRLLVLRGRLGRLGERCDGLRGHGGDCAKSPHGERLTAD